MGTSWETAIHESGHSIMRLLIEGRACAVALAEGPGPVRGWAGGDPDAAPTLEDFDAAACEAAAEGLGFEEAFKELCVVESGHAAVAIFRRKGWMPYTVSVGDGRLSDAIARRMLPDADQTTINSLIQTAHWHATCRLSRVFAGVEAVAAALEVKRRLTAGEVTEAYAAALRAEAEGAAEAEGGGNDKA